MYCYGTLLAVAFLLRRLLMAACCAVRPCADESCLLRGSNVNINMIVACSAVFRPLTAGKLFVFLGRCGFVLNGTIASVRTSRTGT